MRSKITLIIVTVLMITPLLLGATIGTVSWLIKPLPGRCPMNVWGYAYLNGVPIENGLLLGSIDGSVYGSEWTESGAYPGLFSLDISADWYLPNVKEGGYNGTDRIFFSYGNLYANYTAIWVCGGFNAEPIIFDFNSSIGPTELKINEICPIDDGRGNQYVEIYNPSSENVSLSDYYLQKDVPGSTNQYNGSIISLNGTINSQGVRYVNLTGTNYLEQSADELKLVWDNNGTPVGQGYDVVIDRVEYGNQNLVPDNTTLLDAPSPPAGWSIKRTPDGQDTNDCSVDFCISNTPDVYPPDHSNEFPAIDGFTNNRSPSISVHVTDSSGVNSSSIRYFIDGFLVFHELALIPEGYNVSYKHEGSFVSGHIAECRIIADDMEGNRLDFTWFFTVDLIAPSIILTDPLNGQVNVPLANHIIVVFSESVNQPWTQSAFQIMPYVNGAFLWSNLTLMIFDPSGSLYCNTTYTITITTLARDLAGNCLATNYTWSFVTEPADFLPPDHSNEFPPIDSYTTDQFPTISVHVIDVSGVNTTTIGLYVNGYRVFHLLTSIPNGYNVSYWHESGFNWGEVVTCRIKAEDMFGNAMDFTWTFTVAMTFDIPLQQGWNLISLPFEQFNTSLPEVLKSIDGKWIYSQIYDATDSDHWKSNATFRPDTVNDLKYLNHKQGIYIFITEPNVTLQVRGAIPTTTSIPLYAGINIVGYPTLSNTKTIGEALAGTGAYKVEVFNASAPYQVKEVGPSYIMKPGEGYWIYVPTNTVWIVNW